MAGQAVDAARSRGWSIEYIRELFLEAGGDREPERWEPGQLANWLTRHRSACSKCFVAMSNGEGPKPRKPTGTANRCTPPAKASRVGVSPGSPSESFNLLA